MKTAWCIDGGPYNGTEREAGDTENELARIVETASGLVVGHYQWRNGAWRWQPDEAVLAAIAKAQREVNAMLDDLLTRTFYDGLIITRTP